MRKIELQDEEYFNYLGEDKYGVCGELVGTYIVLGDFRNGEFTLISCPFENSCYLIKSIDS